jgi:hypothetical protein
MFDISSSFAALIGCDELDFKRHRVSMNVNTLHVFQNLSEFNHDSKVAYPESLLKDTKKP